MMACNIRMSIGSLISHFTFMYTSSKLHASEKRESALIFPQEMNSGDKSSGVCEDGNGKNVKDETGSTIGGESILRNGAELGK